MISFSNDYSAGAHPKVLEKLVETNMVMEPGYGMDSYCESAKEKIRQAIDCPDAQITFLVGGTQTNQIVISTMLRDYEGVISAETGHVSVHEAGAIEYSGKKVITIPQEDGKVKALDIQKYIENFYNDGNHEHMVFPGMVYISHPTEYGTLYSKEELEEISNVCHMYQIPLFVDGARLGYGVMSRHTDVTLADMARLSDVFYIGGTKVGALCGEAVIFTKNNQPAHFVNSVKKRGALLAKGRLLGVQFDTLFTDNLYLDISKHAIDMAEMLIEVLEKHQIPFFLKSPTNQQFVILENEQVKKIEEQVMVGFWEKYDENHTVIRFATSWYTTKEDIEALDTILSK